MTQQQRKDLMNDETARAMRQYDNTQQQLAFVEGFVQCAFDIDMKMMSVIDIREREPLPGERVLAIKTDYRTDDDFDCEAQMLRYDKELFDKLGVRHWVPSTLNIVEPNKTEKQ